MNMVTHSVVFGVVLPIVASVVVLGVPLVMQMRDGATAEGASTERLSWAWVGGLALALAYVVGFVGLLGRPAWPVTQAHHWLVWLLPAALLLALLQTAWRIPTVAHWLGRAVLLGAMYYLMFRTQVKYETWTSNQFYLYVTLMTGVSLALWAFWDSARTQLSEAQLGWHAMVFSLLSSVALVLSNTAKLAQLMGVMVAGLGVWWVFSWFARWRGVRLTWTQGVFPVFVMIHAGLGFNGYFYANMTTLTGAMLLTAPLLLAVVPRFVSLRKTWQAVALHTLLVVVPIGIALGVLLVKEMQKPKDPYYGMLSTLGLG